MTSCQGGKGTGTLYTYAQLEGLWQNAGGSPALSAVMAAIALAESGGCSTAYNASGATGLWQILGAVDPADQANLTDPAVNAKEAVLKYKSQGLGAWQTYTSNAYKGFLSNSTTPDTNVPGTAGTGSAAPATSACVLNFPGVAGLGATCIVSKSEARAMIGGMLLAAGGLMGGVGVLILAAGAFGRSGGLSKAADVAAVVPGGQPAAAGLAAASARATRTGAQARQRQQARKQGP